MARTQFWFLPLGYGYQTAMLSLPLPCHYEDLTALACQGELSSIALFVDVSADSVCESIGHWRKLLPVTHLKLVVALFNQQQVEYFLKVDGNSSIVAVIPDNFVKESEIRKIDSLVWGTCAPYDSSGVYVKTDIEKSLVAVLHRTKGVFLVHDLAYNIIRQFDGDGLRDRVYEIELCIGLCAERFTEACGRLRYLLYGLSYVYPKMANN